jgi:glycosyltransferase involved in cell wall biosynthesis
MKVCILSAFEDSLSRSTGYSVRIYNLAAGLAELGDEVHIIIPKFNVRTEKFDALNVHKIRGFLPKKVLSTLSRLFGVTKSTSLYFYDPIFILRASEIIRQADVVQIEQQPAGGLFVPIITKVWKKPVVADCHDVFQSLRVEHAKRIRRILEIFLETITYRFADVLLTVSEKEKELLVSYGIKQREIKVIANGVDTEQFNNSTVDVSRVKKRYGLENCRVVIFVGNMEYLPNREAVEFIASKVAPKVQKEINNTKFLIVGRTASKMELPNLTFTGVVKNVAELLAASDVAIAPLFHGSGTRLKILEYFSCGLPVVSTTVGVEGLQVEKGVHVLIEDDMDEFANKVVELLKDKALSTRLGRAARELVVNRYDWKKIAKQLNIVYHNLIFGTNTRLK